MRRKKQLLVLSIGGVLALAAFHQPALAGPCDGVAVEVAGTTVLVSPDGSAQCFAATPDAAVTVTGNAAPLVPLGSMSGTTTYSYDARQSLRQDTDAGETTSETYSNGLLQSSTDPLGRTTTYQYDPGPRLGTTNSNGIVTQYDYAGTPTVTDSQSSGRTTTYQYDALDRTVSATAPGGSVTQYTYDAGQDITSETAPGGAVTTYSYDGGRLAEITEPGGRVYTFSYDGGDLTSITDPNGTTTMFSYDPGGLIGSDSGNSDSGIAFAYVAPVPEPSTLALAATGLVGLLGFRRRQRQAT